MQEKSEEATKPAEPKIKKESPPATIELDRLNSELHLVIESDGFTAGNMTGEGFQFMWGGVRATHGVKKGKVWF